MKTITFTIISTLILLVSMITTANAEYSRGYPEDADSLLTEAADMDSTAFDTAATVEQHKEVVTKGDTTYISIPGKKIQIIEKDGETDVKIKDKDSDEDDFTFNLDDDDEEKQGDEGSKKRHRPGKDFKGHWAGIEFGLNNYMDSDYSLSRSDESAFLDINTGKSWNINWNLLQYSLGFGTDRLGLVTGLGLEWNNYHFRDTTSICVVNNDIAPLVFSENIQTDNILKNRLQTTYLTIPLILEAQLLGKERNKRLYAGVGIITGLKLFSNTKIKYVEDGRNMKDKNRSDFYLSPFRYGITARLGYRALKLYANYYITPLFQENKGPETLNPVAAGLVISF
jgi:hypothetical protein